MEEIVALVEAEVGIGDRADEAAGRGGLPGGSAGRAWAKQLHWHTSFGVVAVWEPQLLVQGRLCRAFAETAEVHCCGYSLPLQRRIVDCGVVQVAFGQVAGRWQEHYGIEVPISAVQAITQNHAPHLYEQEKLTTLMPARAGVATLSVELDGSRVPIVDAVAVAGDQRKTRTVRWQEARLSLAHAQGAVRPVFAAPRAGIDTAGDQLLHCASHAGMGSKT